MVRTSSKNITLAEFLILPETKPASEYIDGEIIQKPMAQGKHSTIQGELIITVNLTVKPKRIARAYPELRCTFGGKSIVPDVSVFTWQRIPRDENGQVANVFKASPDWTIEILSPDQRQTKVTKNILHSLNYETQMGWLIDPEEQTVFVYIRNQQPVMLDELEALLPVPDFASELRLTVGNLFGWLF
ncbi:Uma2 family endonuclease [Nostoc sp.]|uniref:Uma2 family endonuclease n=1 Tax=Nostoc sp. TaxID=1180 RepID=UPI002FFCCF81